MYYERCVMKRCVLRVSKPLTTHYNQNIIDFFAYLLKIRIGFFFDFVGGGGSTGRPQVRTPTCPGRGVQIETKVNGSDIGGTSG